MKKSNNILKYISILFFIGFIFTFPIINIFTPDAKISETENKILSQLPKLSFNKIIDGSFMRNFDKYTTDQFPFRIDFVKMKNSFNYMVGNYEFRDIYVGEDGRLMEKFIFNKNIIDKNISQANILASYLYDTYNIPSKMMIVPTSIAFYSDDLPKYALYDNQEDTLSYIKDNLNMDFYTPFNILKNNKNKYIYFNTDHHWTQLGASLAYEDMYGNKVVGDYKKVSDDFYGTYYSKVLLSSIKGDSIFSYGEYNNFKMSADFDKTYNNLYDDSKLSGKNKYQYFLHGDPAIAVIEGKAGNNKEILIYKDSYAHNFIPFLTNEYDKIHVVDPRYYKLDVDEYLSKNNNINEVLFIYNISSFNSTSIYR